MSAESAELSQPLIRKFNKDQVPKPRINVDELIEFLKMPKPLFIEIGCGVGLHSTNWALNNPNQKLIAIEKTKEKFNKFRNRYAENKSPNNLIPIHAHAISIISHFILDRSVEEYFLFFPNPEIKNPQARWIRMPFFSELLRTLKPGGKIHFVTNKKFYSEEIEEYAIKAWGLKVVHTNYFGTPRTHFEKKYRERGHAIYSISLLTPE